MSVVEVWTLVIEVQIVVVLFVRFVLPIEIGVVTLIDEVLADTIRQVLQGM